MSQLFPTGPLSITPGALEAAPITQVLLLLCRHVSGDWDDLDAEDKRRNDEALTNGARLFSAYEVGDEKVWVITEWDRSLTTVLLPSEY